jgi:hypothetical protein
MTLRRFFLAVPALLAAALLAGCYYPPPQAYAPYPAPACAPIVNPDGTASPGNCYGYAPSYAYPSYPYYPYPAYYYPPYYAYPPVAVGVGFGFGFRGRFR